LLSSALDVLSLISNRHIP